MINIKIPWKHRRKTRKRVLHSHFQQTETHTEQDTHAVGDVQRTKPMLQSEPSRHQLRSPSTHDISSQRCKQAWQCDRLSLSLSRAVAAMNFFLLGTPYINDATSKLSPEVPRGPTPNYPSSTASGASAVVQTTQRHTRRRSFLFWP